MSFKSFWLLYSIVTQLLLTMQTLCHISLNLPGVELAQSCGIPPRTQILFYSIPDTNALTHIKFTFTPLNVSFQLRHFNSNSLMESLSALAHGKWLITFLIVLCRYFVAYSITSVQIQELQLDHSPEHIIMRFLCHSKMQIPPLSCAQAHLHANRTADISISTTSFAHGPSHTCKENWCSEQHFLSRITISRGISRVTKLPFACFCSLSYHIHSKLHPLRL